MGVDLHVPLPRTLLQTYTIEAEDDYFDHDTLSYEQITQELFELEPVGEGTGKCKGSGKCKGKGKGKGGFERSSNLVFAPDREASPWRWDVMLAIVGVAMAAMVAHFLSHA